MSLYTDVEATGGYISNHYSDLYIEVNEVNTDLLRKHGKRASTFINEITGKLCYEIPFAFDPWWEGRSKKKT